MILSPLKIKFLSTISKSSHYISKQVAFLNSLSKTESKYIHQNELSIRERHYDISI